MNDTEKALQQVTVFLEYEEMNRATYEDTCGTGDLTEEERTELYQEMDKQINMLKTIKSALEKQIPKKAIKTGNMCPVCHSYLASEPVGDHYCFNCGQAISWEDEDETNTI